MVWVMVGALVFGFAGIGWNLIYLQENSTQSVTRDGNQAVRTCEDLREFILAEEKVSFPLWKSYHRQVMRYAKGLPKAERPAKVTAIAESVTVVLRSDLRIYREMKRLPECLDGEFRSEVQEWIATTKEMIAYLEGRGEIDGNRFDPGEGFWDTSFYDAFYSAAENLISGLQQI